MAILYFNSTETKNLGHENILVHQPTTMKTPHIVLLNLCVNSVKNTFKNLKFYYIKPNCTGDWKVVSWNR